MTFTYLYAYELNVLQTELIEMQIVSKCMCTLSVRSTPGPEHALFSSELSICEFHSLKLGRDFFCRCVRAESQTMMTFLAGKVGNYLLVTKEKSL